MRIECIENLIKSYDLKQIEDLWEIIKKTKIQFPDYSFSKTKLARVKIYPFYIKLAQKLDDSFSKIINKFTKEEKKIIRTVICKSNDWYFNITDVNAEVDAYVELATFFRDNEKIIHQINEKIKQIEKDSIITKYVTECYC